jgi:hypothetical protein
LPEQTRAVLFPAGLTDAAFPVIQHAEVPKQLQELVVAEKIIQVPRMADKALIY